MVSAYTIFHLWQGVLDFYFSNFFTLPDTCRRANCFQYKQAFTDSGQRLCLKCMAEVSGCSVARQVRPPNEQAWTALLNQPPSRYILALLEGMPGLATICWA